MSEPKPIHDRIAAKVKGLTTSKLHLAAHLGEHLELWAFESAAQLAGRLGVHRSSIVRIAQKLDLSGFPELQTKARDALLKCFSPSNELSLTRAANVQVGMVEQIYQRNLMNLRQTHKYLDLPALEATAREIAAANRVVLFDRRFLPHRPILKPGAQHHANRS